LNTLDFPLLTAVDTTNFDQLPSVSTFNFSSGPSSVTNVFITNTSLSTLEGIDLQNADNIQITNNAHLVHASLPFETAKDVITVSFNGPLVNLSLPQLTSAGHIILRNIAAASLPSLNFLSDIFTLLETSVTELALDSLSVASLNLTLLYNDNLTTTSFQGLL
jgi:hypothetical protein